MPHSKLKLSLIDRLTLISISLYGLAFSLISIHRYRQFDVFYYDFGIFDRAIWLVSRFKPPIIDHMVVGGKLIFADHFSPGIYLLSPLYWLTSNQEIILITQAIIVAASGYIVYLLAKHYLKHPLLSLGITTCYLLFIGLQNALISDFHAATTATLPFLLIFYAIAKNKPKLLYLFFLLFLSFKESHAVYGPAIAFYLWLAQKHWRKHAIIIFITSFIYGYLVINHIIPFFSGDNYHYQAHLSHNPFTIIYSIFNHPQKLDTINKSLLSFGFLPIFSPITYPLILTDWVTRFTPVGSEGRWGLGLHYSALLAPTLAIASVHGAFNLKSLFPKKLLPKSTTLLSFFLIGLSLFLTRFYYHGPILLATNRAFYVHSQNFAFLNHLIDSIPQDASVMTQNNLASHFTHHQNVWLVKSEYGRLKPDYIVLDLRPDQNPNNLFMDLSADHLLDKLALDDTYQLTYHQGDQYIFSHIQD